MFFKNKVFFIVSIFDPETFVSECFVNCKGYYTFNTDSPPTINVYLSLNLFELFTKHFSMSLPDCSSAMCPIRELFPVSCLPGRLYQDPPQWSSSEKTMIRLQPSHNPRHLLLERCLWRGCQGVSPVQNQAGSSIALDWRPQSQASNYCQHHTKLSTSLTWFSTT